MMLETQRLRLRELRQDDFDELYAMFNDPLVMRYYRRRKGFLTVRWRPTSNTAIHCGRSR